MRKAVIIMMVLLIAMMVIGCTRVNPGYVGIKVNMAGSQKGVEDFPLVTGWVFYMPGVSTVFEYPTFMQTAVWTHSKQEGKAVDESLTFNDKDQVPVNVDINLSYMLEAKKVPHFYVQFRSDDVSHFTHGYLRSVARDAFNNIGSRYSFDEINGPKKEEFLAKVRHAINEDVEKWGVKVEQFGIIGALRPPQNIAEAINMKTAAIQKAIQAENELRQAKAEAQKAIAKATGEAESNKILTASITPTLLEWRRLQITQDAVAKWNGARPMVEGMNSGGMLLNINPNK